MASKAIRGLAGLAALFAARADDAAEAFARFQKDFNKKYSSSEEESLRLKVFRDNFNYIKEQNGQGLSYQLDVNQFADMTPDEFSMSHTGISASSMAALPNLGRHQVGNATLPESVDWTTKNVVNPVKNQAQCGSCWAFSTIGALEGAWAIATGKLISLSEQQLVDCSRSYGNNGCSGGLMDNAFKYEVTVAVCTEASYNYTAQNGVCKASKCAAGIPSGGVVGFKDIDHNDQQALMSAVVQQPVSVAIEADQSAFQLYKSGVLTKACGARLDHGVLIVGYGSEDGLDYWLVRNSWGPGWGLHGYVKIQRGVAGPGECGIKSMPSYPVVKASEAEPVTINI